MADAAVSSVKTPRRLTLIIAAALLMALNLNTFIHAGGLIPGGFTGLSLLIQQIVLRYLNIQIPFSILLYAFNFVPAVICFRHVGKKFTLYSVLMVFLCGLLTDAMPRMFIETIQLHDTLLTAIFSGIINGFAIILCLNADATSGGTDLIAIYFSEKRRKDTWNHIFAGNCVILVLAGVLFSMEKALYSIVFQFSTTMILNTLYHAYQQKTMFIVTNRPEEVYALINEKTNHGATLFKGKGMYQQEEHSFIYLVVYSDEALLLTNAIHKIDSDSFINVIKTEHINGKFFRKPRD